MSRTDKSNTPTPSPESLKDYEQQRKILLQIIDQLPDYIYVKDEDGRYLLDNLAHRRFLGVEQMQDLEGKTVFDLFPEELATSYNEADRKAIDTGQKVLGQDEPIPGPDGDKIWIASTRHPLKNEAGKVVGMTCIARDVTRRKLAESALTEERELLHTMMANLPDFIYFKDRESRFIHISHSLARHIGVRDPAEACGKTDFDYFDEPHARDAFNDEQKIMSSGVPMVAKEEHEDWDDGHTTWVSTTKIPLYDALGKCVGTMGISRDITDVKRAEAEVLRYNRELEQINELLKADIAMASEMQQALLPQTYPSFPPQATAAQSALQFHHRYHPSGAVGGDFFTVLPLSDTRAGIFICDVMGHGIRSALVTAMIRTLLGNMGPEANDPGTLLTLLNRQLMALLTESQATVFTSAFYLVLDALDGSLRFATAGHPPPFVLRNKNKTVDTLTSAKGLLNSALGLFDDAAYETETSRVEQGDTLMLYTDGLFEVPNAANEDFDPERLLECVRSHMDKDFKDVLDRIIEDVLNFSSKHQFDDDVCIVGVEASCIGPRVLQLG